ncbi:flagellar hook-associated protein FlgK [Acidaminobacterium chupaoyuni]
MRPTFMGFETAKSAIFANQKSLDIVGNNLTNIETNGYTRQRVERTSIAPSSFSTKIASGRVGLAGQGVEALGVSQLRDAFLDKCFRDEYATASYHTQAAGILNTIQNVLTDGKNITSASGLQGAIEEIYKGLQAYIKEPTLDSGANIVMSSFKNIAQVLNQLDEKLTTVAAQQVDDLQVTVNRTNEILAQIAHLNEQIGSDATVLANPKNEYFRANELLDQRNLLLDELSGYGDIKVTQLSNGVVDVALGGHEILKGTDYTPLTMYRGENGRVAVRYQDSGSNVSLGGGSILASLNFINGKGSNVQNNSDSPVQGIPYCRDRLDTFAGALAAVVNKSVPERDPVTNKPKTDANGSIIYKTLLSAKDINGATSAQLAVKASNISISDEWARSGPGYFIYSKNENVEDYAQKISAALMDTAHTFQSYGEKFAGSFSDYLVEFTAKIGSDLKFHTERQKATGAVADDYLSQRDAISGVSKDEEAADMLRFQKSYEAAARLMTTLDEVLDVLINRMGRVGL